MVLLEMALVSQGKCLIDDVSKAVSLLREGNQKQATRDLGLLKVRAQQLCAETLKLARQLEMEREHYKTAVEVMLLFNHDACTP